MKYTNPQKELKLEGLVDSKNFKSVFVKNSEDKKWKR